MKRILFIICIFVIIAFYVLLAGCENDRDNSMEQIVEIWEEMYGEGYVLKMPDSGIYCSLWPSQVEPDRTPSFTLSVLHSDLDKFRFEKIAPIGDQTYRCYTDKASYEVGEDITVHFENNSEFNVAMGAGNDIDLCISVNGEWYILNRNFPVAATETSCSPGAEHVWTIDEYFFHLLPHYYDSRTNTYSMGDEWRAYDLPKGHYKIIIRFSSTTTEYHGAQCEFDII